MYVYKPFQGHNYNNIQYMYKEFEDHNHNLYAQLISRPQFQRMCTKNVKTTIIMEVFKQFVGHNHNASSHLIRRQQFQCVHKISCFNSL